MLHYVQQLVTNCVCLLLAAGQVVYSGVFWRFFTDSKVKTLQLQAVNNELKDASMHVIRCQ